MALWLAEPLVVATRSKARKAMLAAAGIPIETVIPEVDERAVEARSSPRSASEAAMLLARAKAGAAAPTVPGRIVLGADQTLALESDRFAKPADRDAAREQLRRLGGRTHELHSAVAVARGDRVLFERVETAKLTMRALSDRFIETYLDAAGPAVVESVGAYQLENLGVHLFERIEGDHFTILGLPLVPLLGFFRREGLLAG